MFLVSVESFIVSWTQSSWLMRLSYPWWHAHLSGRCQYLMYDDEHSDRVAVQPMKLGCVLEKSDASCGLSRSSRVVCLEQLTQRTKARVKDICVCPLIDVELQECFSRTQHCGANNTNVHIARLIAGVQRAVLDVHDLSIASGSANVFVRSVCSQRLLQWNWQADITDSQSLGLSPLVVALVVGQWSSSVITSTYWRSAISVLSPFLMQASSSRERLFLIAREPQSNVRLELRAFEGILCPLYRDSNFRWRDVCTCRVHRKWTSRSRFVKVVSSWFRRTVGPQSGQGSREVLGPSVHGRMCFASSLRMSIWKFQGQMRMRCRLLKESCANF